LLFCCACASSPAPKGAGFHQAPAWAAPELERAIAVRNARTGAALSWDQLLDDLAGADVVFLGELHTDETTHRVELGVYQGLLARRSDRVVLAMEMFDRDVQPALDDYLRGKTSEADFLAASRPWANYATAYRPLIEMARSGGLPVVASNFPAPLRRTLAMSAQPSLDALAGADRNHVPRELLANTPEYWRRVDNAIRGHVGMMGASPEPSDPRLYSTQSLWDNSMGEACALALERYPGSLVLHVNGAFHSAYRDGTVRQLVLRKPDAKVLTVSVQPTSNPSVADPRGKPVADYVVYAEERATDLNEGTYSVYANREVEYRLHLPEAEPTGSGWPLLLWFSDDGLTAEEGLALWRPRLGDECALAVIESPYKATQADLMEGGRWFWPDSFTSDLGTLVGVAEETWAFLLRHYPIDPQRVCVAGEGTGATLVSAVSLLSERMGARAVAFAPRRYAKLKDIPLPLPEERGDDVPPAKSLRVFLGPNDAEWWSKELTEYTSIGLENDRGPSTTDPWLHEIEQERALRKALGLDMTAVPESAARGHILVATPRARHWARLVAIERWREDGCLVAVLDSPPTAGDSTEIDTSIHPGTYATGEGIPRCPGPFGGTTVIVLPESTPAEEIEAWLAIERADPVNQSDRFRRMRVATAAGDLQLLGVLQTLEQQGRHNVLVVPAVFAADVETMRALERSVRALDDVMTLHWRPGLGAPRTATSRRATF
jgi:uncharacterized iron-regulated protein